ncbi:hypothetical protein QAD02_004505 [Eretmocerus hayati]|uniref:Uncharacterized protein n=1 Tax=Eretmocerus hayati TaxID=131215 RepID=A0ACC2NQW4_9HYME|nr:hypothetical protein QAD02_004505 [Eretmocerus hayati]
MYRIIFVTVISLSMFCADSTVLRSNTSVLEQEYGPTTNHFPLESIIDLATNRSMVDGNNQEILPVRRRKRMVGSYVVNDYDYPYVVSLKSSHSHRCGGTILTPRLILTAAHCIKAKDSISHVEVSGENGKERYPVTKKISHPNYQIGIYDKHDIGVVLLGERIPNAHIVSLQPHPQRVRDRSEAYAFGWGQTGNGFTSQELRRADLPLLLPSQCENKPGHNVAWVCIDSSKADTCPGDSGGPLMYKNKQVGITSHGKYPANYKGPKCKPGFLSFFTRVSFYYDWIQRYIELYP